MLKKLTRNIYSKNICLKREGRVQDIIKHTSELILAQEVGWMGGGRRIRDREVRIERDGEETWIKDIFRRT